MTGSVSTTRRIDSRTTTVTHGASISPSGSSYVRTIDRLLPSLSDSDLSTRRASPTRSTGAMRRSGDVRHYRTILIQKVLRFWQKGRQSSSQLARISSGFLTGNSLAVKGDALIHGPRLVARTVGSEWRTQRPFQGSIQTK
jgi:hypothetical protein